MTPSLSFSNPASVSPPGGHYSHVATANGFVFVSGQLPITPAGEKLVDATFAQQATLVLDNLAAILAESGSSIAQLVQVRVYLTSSEHWAEFNRLYAQWAGDSRPARAVVPVRDLHYGFQIEIEAVAMSNRSA